MYKGKEFAPYTHAQITEPGTTTGPFFRHPINTICEYMEKRNTFVSRFEMPASIFLFYLLGLFVVPTVIAITAALRKTRFEMMTPEQEAFLKDKRVTLFSIRYNSHTGFNFGSSVANWPLLMKGDLGIKIRFDPTLKVPKFIGGFAEVTNVEISSGSKLHKESLLAALDNILCYSTKQKFLTFSNCAGMSELDLDLSKFDGLIYEVNINKCPIEKITQLALPKGVRLLGITETLIEAEELQHISGSVDELQNLALILNKKMLKFPNLSNMPKLQLLAFSSTTTGIDPADVDTVPDGLATLLTSEADTEQWWFKKLIERFKKREDNKLVVKAFRSGHYLPFYY